MTRVLSFVRRSNIAVRAAVVYSPVMRIGDRNAAPRIFAAVCLAAFFLQSFTAMQRESDSWDEGMAIASDALRIFRGNWRVADYAPPLHTWLNRPALHFLKPVLPPPGTERTESEMVYGNRFLYERNHAQPILQLCRLSVLLMACLMGAVLYRWAARIGGPWSGAWAVFLMAVEPNLLTHSRIAAWDMLCAASMFIAAYACWSWLQAPTLKSALCAGAALGIALISKYTALILLPVFMTGILADQFTREDDPRKSAKRPIPLSWMAHLVAALAVAAGVVGLSYYPEFGIEHYVRGMSKIYLTEAGDYQYYLLGRVHDQPLPLYYVWTVLLKTPAPILLLILAALALRSRCGLSLRHALFILSPVAWMVLASAFDRHNLCLRRILPIYPFLILFAAQTRTLWGSGRMNRIALSIIAAWLLLGAARTYPHHLSYFNELAGGPAAGIHRLDECNVDWGQDLPGLADYLTQNGIAEVRMPEEEAGLFNRGEYYGIRYARVSAMEFLDPRPAVYALSAHRVVWLKKQAVRSGDSKWNWMDRFRPSGRIGHSIYIYDFRQR